MKHITKINGFVGRGHLELDPATVRNLELFSTLRDNQREGSLLSVIDNTNTSMGARLLRNWLQYPQNNKEIIIERLNSVQEFISKREIRQQIKNHLKKTTDIERLLSRMSIGISNARDLVSLKQSIREITEIAILLSNESNLSIKKELNEAVTGNVQGVIKLIDNSILEEPSLDVKNGNIIKTGVNSKLDDLRALGSEVREWLAHFERKAKKETGIGSLKVSYNKVFGYYIEVSKANLSSVPESYIRKQTLVNAERYITPQLKEQEEKVLAAEDVSTKLEHELFLEVTNEVLKSVEELQTLAKIVAYLDCLINFSDISEKNNYVLPEIVESGDIDITDGRHPVVEKLIENEQFVPNDTAMGVNTSQLHIITGPNMAGKSVYIRQVALIVLLAHIGCFVPAKKATVSIVDRIFVRSGASDVITKGLSTFMIEMVEAAYILNHATNRSLIVMDEIGRGTSTYDGISIASAIAEYLVTFYKEGGPKTLFATHYHELQNLEDQFASIVNFQVAVKHENGEPVFLHKVIPGGASHSYGVSVARMAGVPIEVVSRAEDLLREFEKDSILKVDAPLKTVDLSEGLLIYKKLEEVDVNKLTPLDALNLLQELQTSLKERY
ncbi:DNA mismatch repair protein MutS [Patescibacteria group bacterium]